MTQKPYMVMVGPVGQGGIDTIIQMYRAGGLFETDGIFIPSYEGEATTFKNMRLFFQCLFGLLITFIRVPTIQVVHFHSSFRGSFYRKAFLLGIAKCCGKKTVFHMNGSQFMVFAGQGNAFIQKWIRKTLQWSDRVLAVSSVWQNDLYRLGNNVNTMAIYNPTILKTPKTHLDKETLSFVFMGRLGQRKGTYDLVEAAAKLRSSHVQIHLYGDGDLVEIQQRIETLGVSDRVQIHGWIAGADKDKAFQDADVLVLPTYHEGQPLAVLEAMAWGLPVISTPVGGIPEAVTDGVNGYLISPGDTEVLAARMDQLAESLPLRQQMGAAAYKMAQDKFSIPVILEQLRELYRDLCDPLPTRSGQYSTLQRSHS